MSSYWFTRLLVLGLFFLVLMHDFGDHHSAYAYQGKAYGVGAAGERTVTDRKEPLQGISRAWKGGRKMMSERSELGHKEEAISEKGLDVVPKKTPEIKAQDQLKNQVKEKAMLYSVQKDSKMNNSIANEEEEAKDNEKDEERRELMNELASLMEKDYSRFGRRKPPINNHEPRH